MTASVMEQSWGRTDCYRPFPRPSALRTMSAEQAMADPHKQTSKLASEAAHLRQKRTFATYGR